MLGRAWEQVNAVGVVYSDGKSGCELKTRPARPLVGQLPLPAPGIQPFPAIFLYHSSRRNQPAALAALINTLRLSD